MVIWARPQNHKTNADILFYVPSRSDNISMHGYIIFNRLCWKYIRSYTFRATLSLFCESAIRYNTFLLRSYTCRLTFQRFCYKVLRSHTFPATLPSKCEDVIHSYTFRLCSYTFPNTSGNMLLKVVSSYTFCEAPLLKCRNVIPPSTFLLCSLVYFGRSYFAATLLPPSFTLPTIWRLVLKDTRYYVPIPSWYVPWGPFTLGSVVSHRHAYWIQVRQCAV